ncbi:hypothetical protein PENTCL1PPCAC_811, partial [Pristionchus entomophagus]
AFPMTEMIRSWTDLASSGLDYVLGGSKEIVKQDDEKQGFPSKVVAVFVSGLKKSAMKQVSKRGPVKKAIYREAAAGAGVIGALATVALAIPVALDTYRVGVAVKKDYEDGTHHNTVQAGAEAVGGWTGVALGASVGAAVVGPVGGVAGGVVGAWAGLKGSDAVVDSLPEKFRSKL